MISSVKFNVSKNMDQVRDYIISCVTDELREIFPYVKFAKKELFNEAAPCIFIQTWYYEKFNNLYIYFEIDDYCKYVYKNPEDVFKRISQRLVFNLHKSYRVNPIVVRPNINPYYNKHMDSRIILDLKTKVTQNIISYWKIKDVYALIGDSNVLSLDIYRYTLKKEHEGEDPKERFEEYINKLMDLSNKYDTLVNAKIPELFEEYKVLYKEMFGTDLESAKEQDIRRIYIEAEYGEE